VALHQKLKSTSYTPQDVRLITVGAYNARQLDAAVPIAEMLSHQTLEAGATRQPTESASRASTNGHSTTIEYMAGTGDLRHRPANPPAATFMEVSPERGPVTGGMHITIFGENFPSTPLS